MFDLSYQPNVLYLASIERMAAARRMIDEKPHDYVLACYLAGLAVESIVRGVTRNLVDAAEIVQKKGLAVWLSSAKK